MNRFFRIFLVLALGALVVGTAAAQQRAVFQSVKGKVEMLAPGGSWQPAAAGMSIPLKGTVSTGFGGEAVLEIGNSVVTVRQLTRLSVEELSLRDNVATTSLRLPVGRIRAEVKSAEGIKTDFTMRSPVSTAAVRGTGFEFDGVNLQVFESVVKLINNAGLGTQVGNGESGNAGGNGPPSGGAGEREKRMAVSIYTSYVQELQRSIGNRRNELGTGTIQVEWK